MTIKNISVLCNPDFSEQFKEYLISSFSEKLSTPISTFSNEAIFIYDTKRLQEYLLAGEFDCTDDFGSELNLTDAEKDIILNCKQQWIALEEYGSLEAPLY